jgi:dienelactone hydrolase
MTTLVLFHSALGLRPAVTALADQIRAAGHTVHTPDLYDGRRFDDLDVGVAHRDALGIPTLIERALTSVADLPADVVYGGLSMGTAPAQLLAATRPGALGAVLVHGGLPLEAIGVERWPATVPLQLHTTPGDSWVDEEGLQAVRTAVPANLLTDRTYPGTGHLFTDPGTEGYDAAATTAVLNDALTLLATASAIRMG